MLLRRIELMGFKSFADRTVIEFGPGLSAIVGPNGSGKSNVVDAVRWVLGEASPRALRGQRMEDVIFAGSPDRRPVPLAEVTLVLDNADGTLPVPFAEVSVTRRVDRAGAGGYLVNRRPCRLRDVQQLFAGTGLGRDAFALLGQGEVEEVLRARPAERRGLVEEAAGVSRFRLRLQEGRRRLQAAAAHCTRLADLVGERRRALAALAQQAERAQRHARLSAALRALELGLLASEWAAVRDQRQACAAAAERAAVELEGLQRELAALVTRQREAGEVLVRARVQGDADAALHREAVAALEAARRAAETARQLAAAAAAEARRAQRRGEELRRRRGAVEAEVAQARAAGEAAARRGEVARQLLAAAEARLTNAVRARQSAAQAHASAQAALTAHRQRREQARSAADGLRRAREAEAAAAARVAEAQGALARAEARVAEASREALAAEARARRAAEVLASLRRHRGLLREWAGADRARLQALIELAAAGAGYAEGVRAVLAGRARGDPAFAGVIGPLGELLQVPPRLAAAVAAALGAAVQDLVTASAEEARRAVAALKAARAGRATFLPLGALRAAPPPPALSSLAQRPGALGWAGALVSYPPEVAQAVQHALGRVLVAADLSAAQRLAQEAGYRVRVVTLDGEVIHAGGAISGGAVKGEGRAGLLGRRAEERRLARRLEAVAADLDWLEAAVGRWSEAARATGLERERWHRALAVAQAERAAADAALVAAQAEWARGVAEAADAARRADAAAGGGGPSEADLVAAEEHARADLAVAEEEETLAREAVTAARVEDAAAGEQRRGVQALAAAGQRELEDLRARLEQAEADGRAAAAAASEQERIAAEADARAQELEQRVAAAEAQWRRAEAAQRQAQEAASEAAARREALERERERAGAALRRAEAELGRAEAARAALAGRLDAAYGLGLQALAEVAPSRHPAVDRARAADLRAELATLGGVRPEAVAEHRALAAETERLERALDDVQQTASGLGRWSRDVERRMGERYEATLAQVRRHFAAVYHRLCGGHADLLPVGDGSSAPPPGAAAGPDAAPQPSEAPGLEVVAQPPGKRLQHLELLSGGERALVAISLLLALLRVRPTAFCMLDEVEAALDDANVERCARLLVEMASSTQFIVVTHQKGTMEAAARLVGVTMGSAGVSSLLSVRLAG